MEEVEMKKSLAAIVGAAVITVGIIFAVQAAQKKHNADIVADMGFLLGVVEGATEECAQRGLVEAAARADGHIVGKKLISDVDPKTIEDLDSCLRGMELKDLRKMRLDLASSRQHAKTRR